jgi:DNA topoisomerase I
VNVSCALTPRDEATVHAAEAARLVFSADCSPGIRRVRRGTGFAYRHQDGRPVSKRDRKRIELLKIPPAWRDVWICADEHGHLQATGRDARGRKQYRYHDRWRVIRDAHKFDRLVTFGESLPEIRRRVDTDLRRRTLARERVLALAVAVMDETLVRVGHPRYVRENRSHGLTTLRDEHAEVGTARVRLRFRGKAGKKIVLDIDNARIARAMSRVRDLPGQELFQYIDEMGDLRVVGSHDINAYLREIAGAEVVSKDFRTWGGSLVTAIELHRLAGASHADSAVAEAVRVAAHTLHNTPAVARRAYVHPGIISLYRSGGLERAWKAAALAEPERAYLQEEERVFLGILRQLQS